MKLQSMRRDIDVFVKSYYQNLKSCIDTFAVTDQKGNPLQFYPAIRETAEKVASLPSGTNKLMFIGNGASQAISSHMSTDFWKTGGIRSMAFTDCSLLTCIGNDFGYDNVFGKPIEMFADQGDILVAISSSGRSQNIINGVDAARKKDCSVITLSGFSPDNPLRTLGDMNFYVPAEAYGPVEILHHSICHCILDAIVNCNR